MILALDRYSSLTSASSSSWICYLVLFLLLPSLSRLAERPFRAIFKKLDEIFGFEVGLTADSDGLLKNFLHFWVHLDHQVSFVCHFHVSYILLVFDPLVEFSLKKSSANICEPLLGNLRQLEWWLWQVMVNFWMLLIQILSDLLDTQSLVSIMEKRFMISKSHIYCELVKIIGYDVLKNIMRATSFNK